MRLGVVAALLAIVSTAGCEPTCAQSCRKVIGCDLESQRVVQDECEAACVFQERLYDDWEDDTKQAAFSDHKRCLARRSCDEIAAGDCYDPEIFLYPQSDPE
jgi:hypothetical protein